MASVARNTITRNARAVARHGMTTRIVARPAVANFVRFNSSQTPPPPTKPPRTPEQIRRKEALERQDDLQRDWDAKVITYEELMPITEAPTTVRTLDLEPE
jgi:hypothetical protein